MDRTGASEASASKYLKAYRSLEPAIDAYLNSKSLKGATAAGSPSKADVKALDKLFDSYADKAGDAQVGIDGTMRYFSEDLEVDLEEVGVLALQTLLGCPSQGVMARDGFQKYWQSQRAYKLDAMESIAQGLTEQMGRDEALFKKTYLYTFGLALQPPSRTLQLDVACVYWDLLLGTQNNDDDATAAALGKPKFARLEQWKTFLTDKGKGVNRDTWNLLYDFATQVDQETFANYDEEDAWPLTFDEFVTYCKEHGKPA